MMTETPGVYVTRNGQKAIADAAVEHAAEQDSITALVSSLGMVQADAARKAIQRTLDQAREWDRLQTVFRVNAIEIDKLEPCSHAMRGGCRPLMVGECRYCDLLAYEDRTSRRIDDMRRMLGVLP